jgi:hypothetical protein
MPGIKPRTTCGKLYDLIIGSAFIASSAFSNAQGPPPPGSQPSVTDELASTEQRLHQLALEIETMIGKAACQRDDECKTIAYGEKPCGGAREYRVFSIQETNTEPLEHRVARYNRLDQRRNALSSAVSDCAFVKEPVVRCLNKVCQPVKDSDAYEPTFR